MATECDRKKRLLDESLTLGEGPCLPKKSITTSLSSTNANKVYLLNSGPKTNDDIYKLVQTIQFKEIDAQYDANFLVIDFRPEALGQHWHTNKTPTVGGIYCKSMDDLYDEIQPPSPQFVQLFGCNDATPNYLSVYYTGVLFEELCFIQKHMIGANVWTRAHFYWSTVSLLPKILPLLAHQALKIILIAPGAYDEFLLSLYACSDVFLTTDHTDLRFFFESAQKESLTRPIHLSLM
jgi:hypothetical protein